MSPLSFVIPKQINAAPWLVAHSLDELKRKIATDKMVLPICSLGTSIERLAGLAPLVLPPLYHEAMDEGMKSQLLERIRHCFPFYGGASQAAQQYDFQIVELPAEPARPLRAKPRVLAFSVDTAVEEHGPHLPLATDTIQSYAVLDRLADEFEGFVVGPPVEYGHLTWGLPFGLSIDITPPLLTRYVTGFANAMLDWLAPDALYVVDVHGSIVHRNAIQEGLKQSRCRRWSFRWLHEPLVEFAADRGDQHAGGVETSLVHYISPRLLDPRWWPGRVDDLAAKEMPLELAVELSRDLPRFIERVRSQSFNGIVGKIRNFFDLDAELLMDRMLTIAREDVAQLLDTTCKG
jgi:creatinine amidohydrolase/Fe(II)-dependent formamide hydrolase-like protein